MYELCMVFSLLSTGICRLMFDDCSVWTAIVLTAFYNFYLKFTSSDPNGVQFASFYCVLCFLLLVFDDVLFAPHCKYINAACMRVYTIYVTLLCNWNPCKHSLNIAYEAFCLFFKWMLKQLEGCDMEIEFHICIVHNYCCLVLYAVLCNLCESETRHTC